jgi:hypothetical protein
MTVTYVAETYKNFPLHTFRRSNTQLLHTITSPFVPFMAGLIGPALTFPVNLLVGWAAGLAVFVAAAEALDYTAGWLFVLAAVWTSVGLATMYLRVK